MTRIVILIPAYNAAATIVETLKSLMKINLSTYNIETVILADDGSTDNTIQLAQSVWQNSVTLSIVAFPHNVGQYALKHEMMLRLSREGYEWVLILHADDLVRDDWVSTTVGYIETRKETLTSICSSWTTFEGTRTLNAGQNLPNQPAKVITGTSDAVRDTLMRGCWWHISGAAINLARLGSMPNFDPTLSPFADWYWLLSSLSRGETILYIPLALIHYRQHSNSITSQSFHKAIERIAEEIQIFNEFSEVCSTSDIIKWHGERLYWNTRRIVTSIIRGRFRFAYHLIVVIRTVVLNMVKLILMSLLHSSNHKG